MIFNIVLINLMKNIRKFFAIAFLLICSSSCFADHAEKQIQSLFNIYESICIKYLHNMDEARRQLNRLPALPPAKAKHFLAGHAGTAWPVPDKYGTFVLAIHAESGFCAVHAHRASAEMVENKFATTFKAAPAPLVPVLREDVQESNASKISTRRMAYVWSVPGAKRKMLFMLTTSTSEHAPLQAMLSASTISD